MRITGIFQTYAVICHFILLLMYYNLFRNELGEQNVIYAFEKTNCICCTAISLFFFVELSVLKLRMLYF